MKTKTTKTAKDIRIVILQRGWVMVGAFAKNGADCKLTHANVVRVWGTTRGLGEIAADGPKPGTQLDPCPEIQFHELTVIATIKCEVTKWRAALGL